MPPSDGSPFRRPTESDVGSLAEALYLDLDEGEREAYHELVGDVVEGLGPIRHAEGFDPGLEPPDLAGRTGGRRPTDEEDPHNAWIRTVGVSRTESGPLAGVTVGLKDSVALAGVEMTLGSSVMEGFVPGIDATVVSRLLDAGATVVGKLNMESFAWSGRGDLTDFGPVTNPRAEGHLAGGSSSGSAAAPANGDCALALGTDQAGSIRIPSSWCGLVGIKPTHGLVPYTGVVPLERSLDHVGPMGRSTELVARALEAMAGEDTHEGIRLDDRQPTGVTAKPYTDALDDDAEGRSVAVLEEGFGWEFSEPAVDEAVRAAADVLAERGVSVASVSVSRHRESMSAWAGIGTQGGVRHFLEGGAGTNHRGWTWPRLARVLDSFRRARANDLPPTVKRALLTAAYLDDEYGPEPYAKARSIGMALRRDYDAVLEEHDALLLPTTAVRAFEHEAEIDRVDALAGEATTLANTAAFNLTGHPAISVPCAKPDGLPVGLMLVGAHLDEPALFDLASAFEAAVDWETRD